MGVRCARAAVVVAFLGTLLGLAVPSHAGPTFQYSFDQSSGHYLVQPNGSVTVTVYLESHDATGAAVLSSGMLSGGVKLSYTSGDHSVSLNSLAAITGNNVIDADPYHQAPFNESPSFGNPQKYLAGDILAFDPSAQNPVAGIAEFRAVGESTGASGVDLGNNVYRIELGKFTFTAGGLWGGTNTITASNLFDDIGLPYNVTSGGENLENTDPSQGTTYGIASNSFVIEVVPEPPGLVTLAGLAATGGLVGVVQWWRKRRPLSGPTDSATET